MPSIIIMGSKSLVPAFSPSALALRLRSSNASEDSCSSNSSSPLLPFFRFCVSSVANAR